MTTTTSNEFQPTPITDSARTSVKDAADRAHKTIDRAAAAAPAVIDRAAQSAHGAIDQTAGAAQRTVSTVGTTADRLRQIPSEYADTFVEGVRQNPWAAIGIAVLVGFVLGRATD
jgi:ElaB/YqjD/DUF883 family membrane-anchored ribosome-binding protein